MTLSGEPQPSFLEMLADARVSAVHLEMRDAYGVARESADFQAWLAGDTSGQRQARQSPFFEAITTAVERGVAVRRARIISMPPSDYIRFEHAGTHRNIKAGEEVRWLPRRDTSDLALPGNDYWLFDDRLVRFNHFRGDGGSAGPEVTDDPATAATCSSAFKAVWDRAVPHAEFDIN
ncbi:DUF6879 family protein [Streptomyces sp. NPDC006711]|uniref:DUF6879 family protein n=1 Tax=unclassified Streptomyces TaxID=2593676 RepID=UPI0034052893